MDYKKELKRFDLNRIAVLSLLLFIVPFAAALCVNLIWFKRSVLLTDKVYWDILIMLAIFVAGLFCHEGLHALSAIVFGKISPKDIRFGFIPKQMMLYCHVNPPLKAQVYRILLIVPIIVTGIIPLIISAFLGNIFLIIAFALLVSGGAGDLIMFASLLKYDKNQLIIDHPDAPAYYLVYNSDSTPEDFCEVTAEQEEELLNEMKGLSKDKTYIKSKSTLLKTLFILLFFIVLVLAIVLIALFMKLF